MLNRKVKSCSIQTGAKLSFLWTESKSLRITSDPLEVLFLRNTLAITINSFLAQPETPFSELQSLPQAVAAGNNNQFLNNKSCLSHSKCGARRKFRTTFFFLPPILAKRHLSLTTGKVKDPFSFKTKRSAAVLLRSVVPNLLTGSLFPGFTQQNSYRPAIVIVVIFCCASFDLFHVIVLYIL